jgi:trans-aconitate methyltransferase
MYTKQYIKQLHSLHNDSARPGGFGGKPKKLGKFHSFMLEWNPYSLLDYGCGKGYILSELRDKYKNVLCEGYDPAVKMFSALPNKTYDCVFSNDVLEHIEPEYLSDVLAHINDLADKYVWLRIDTMPARKTLPDGRNAHLILESPDWWIDQIYTYMRGTVVYKELTNKGKFDVAIKK